MLTVFKQIIMLKFSFIFFAVFFFSISVKATVGCIITSRSTIYTNFRNGTTYNASPGNFNSDPGCLFIFTGGACTIRNTGTGFFGDTVNPQECPIDDYIWVMMILSGGIGYFVLRKNALKLNFA